MTKLTADDIARILADDAVLPMGAASDMFDILSGVLDTIADLATNRASPTRVLMNIERVAKCAKFQADDYAEYMEQMQDKFNGQQVPAILSAVQGGDDE